MTTEINLTAGNDSSVQPEVRKALEHLNSVLVKGEILEAWAIQRRLFALTHRRILRTIY